MRSKSQEVMHAIITYIDTKFEQEGRVPSMQEIADRISLSKGMVSRYIFEMAEKGLIERGNGFYSLATKKMKRTMQGNESLPIIGQIACGKPIFAEENIESYLSISGSFLGAGEHFVLVAKGDSMINVGIDDGDYVIIRKQSSADEGKIVVALIDNEEATLKRYYNDKRKKKIRLHPENDNLEDMYFDYERISIQGIAIKVIKNIDCWV